MGKKRVQNLKWATAHLSRRLGRAAGRHGARGERGRQARGARGARGRQAQGARGMRGKGAGLATRGAGCRRAAWAHLGTQAGLWAMHLVHLVCF